ESMQPEGDGKLQQEFEKLKMNLAAEGLFAQSSKQALPEHPKRVGVITSKTGAALFDILDVLKRRDPSLPVVVYPTMVQGEEAAIQIAQAIGRANERNECDVLIVGRGGGSLEDLWCFNNEIVARTIAASQIPIISAVGHEVDVTIADFVADMRAPTPSAAAELVSRDNSHKEQAFSAKRARLVSAIRHLLMKQAQSTHALKFRLEKQHPSYQLQKQSQQLDDLDMRLRRGMAQYLKQHAQRVERKQHQLQLNSPVKRLGEQKLHLQRSEQKLLDAMDKTLLTTRHQLAMAAEKLETVSPLATLKRGYSITHSASKQTVSSIEDVNVGEVIKTQVEDGVIESQVTQKIAKA
ncbi:exodeoxyribonuclease VII large subunit, partial [Vibrio sp. D173a]|uniref:exodeoxyribonuclease VII large subunit n=1 Tax=Vibrio sp. D173a TaxID=2836349 RepID=UPI002552FF1C